jgi:protein-S-isoprenylcysteine O-methyltransferase Ste14
MKLSFITIRAVFFATCFVTLWTWVALALRRYDSSYSRDLLPAWSAPAGAAALCLGAIRAMWCIGAFIVRGRGTPAPFDPPRKLVIAGPYRYIRNPMYVGGGLVLLGSGLVVESPSIVMFVPAWWLFVNLLVLLYEEPVLRSKFGNEYEEYCRRTPRWLPRLGNTNQNAILEKQ